MRVTIATTVIFTGMFMMGAPPIKMGLWEVTSVSTTQATGMMADGLKRSGQNIGTPNTLVSKLCLTPETWEKSLAGNAPPAIGCNRSNVVSTPEMMSGTLTCSFGDNSMSADQKTYFDSPEKVHGTQHITSKSARGTMDTVGTTTAKFLGSDCGDVKPFSGIHRPNGPPGQ